MATDNEIVFEDLHGVKEDGPVMVDVDSDLNDEGINRAPTEQVADDDFSDDDDAALSGREDDDQSASGQDDDSDASKDREDDAYSKKVKARIAREQRQTKKARDEASYWREQAEKLAQDTSKRDRDQLKGNIERADSEIESTQSELERAIEDGNTKDQVRLTSKLTDLKAEKIQAEVRLTDLPENGNVPPFDGKVSPPTDEAQSLADEWVEGHNDWYGARGFERQTRLANRLDKEVYKDGFRPDTPEYFKELDKRLKKADPSLYEDLASDEPAERTGDRRRRRSPVAGVDSNTGGRKPSSSKVELTKDDFANMRRFNLDTDNPEVLKEYARNKAAEGGQR